MTEEQKAYFCDEYCKFRERADLVIKAQKEDSDSNILSWLREGAENKLEEISGKCPLNEV